jgi:putative membrane protein
MNAKLIAFVLGVAAAGGVSAQTATGRDVSPPSQEEMQAAMTTPRAFAERAASANEFEIQSSQMALERSQSQDVIAFAERMIADHQAAGEKMVVAVSSEGLMPAKRLMPDHQAQLDNLAAAAAEDFDGAYLGAQLAAHNEAVMLFEGYANQGAEGPLRTFAAETLPALQQHLQEVKPLAETDT